MRSLFVVAVLSALGLALGLTDRTLANSLAWDAKTIVCNVDSANDLHMTYYSDTKMMLLYTDNDSYPNFTGSANGDSTVWICNWSGKMVHLGESVHVGVEFSEFQKNQLCSKNIRWSMDGAEADSMPAVGFNVVPWAKRETTDYIITNFSGNSLTIKDLSYGITPEETRLCDMKYPQSLYFTLSDTVFLQPDSSYTIRFIPPKLTTGYFMVQGRILQESTPCGNFVQQHQHHFWYPAPTLTNWGLVVLLALLILSAIFVIYQKRKGVVRT
jgi:hypothetical protein